MATFNATHDATTYVETASAGAQTKAGLSMFGRLRQALKVRRQRKGLLSLDDRMLADVGLSHADVYREVHRSFLDLPSLPGANKW